MSTSLSNWFNFDLKKSAPFEKQDEVLELVEKGLAKDVERAVRSRIDPGIDKKSATAAEAIKVKGEGGQLTIYAESHAEVLQATSKMVSKSENSDLDAGSLDELFKPSSGVPGMERGADGKEKLVYRRIKLEKVFAEQKEQAQQQTIKQTVENTVSTQIGTRYEEALKEVANKNPEEQ